MADFPIIERSDHRITLLVRGDLTVEEWLVQMIRAILDQLEDAHVRSVRVDMSGVTGFDMRSVAEWIGLESMVFDQGRSLVIVEPSSVVRDVLDRVSPRSREASQRRGA